MDDAKIYFTVENSPCFGSIMALWTAWSGMIQFSFIQPEIKF